MSMTRLHAFLTSPLDKTPRSRVIFWFSLSMVFAVIYAGMALHRAFESSGVIQDDARQHIFWMQRYIDPELFPNDLIADYFQSVAPGGYKLVYFIATFLGIHPLVFCRIIPSFLGIISTPFAFGMSLEILPVPLAGFVGALLMNQIIWLKDDVASGTPRAFIYPIFLAFIYYVLRNNIWGVAISIGLTGLFYPQYVFVGLGILILRLFAWKEGRLCFSAHPKHLKIFAVSFAVAFVVILIYALQTLEFGPAMNRAEALQSLEFFENGRNPFFEENLFDFWFNSRRSGMFPKSLFTPATQCLAWLFPVLFLFRPAFPLVDRIKPGIWVMFQLLISSVVMFLLAHAFLFKLHLPSRYTGISFRIVIAVITIVAFTIILDALLNWIEVKRQPKSEKKEVFPRTTQKIIAGGLIGVMTISLLFYPSFVPFFPLVKYEQADRPELYEFFQQQPKDVLIASVSGEVNQLPTFAQRSILAGREYTISYHTGYYQKMNERTTDLIQAHYSPDLEELKAFIQKYGIDLFLIELYAFVPEYFFFNDWMNEFEEGKQAYQFLKITGEFPALAKTISKCSIYTAEEWFILDASCILKQ
ncbi:hypothetical protein [Lyngbya sp. PCC 8106]|uniref:hypothetical protein n=1 Tax=Lyngbya sp. (strain PCC 8106) TaxID=313612 RepID=UPI0000EADADD|nr:hypothetical protein L8106_23730 [Lyngbya sp. PCC 8106]